MGASVQCKGFLFDLDGTLVDSLAVVERSWHFWAESYGVDPDAVARGEHAIGPHNVAGYLELHIEQGPVLESMELPLGAVLGTFGVERHAIKFTGQAAHSGSTPMLAKRIAAASSRISAKASRM